MILDIYRLEHSQTEGNRGVQMLNGKFVGFSIELPDKDNQPFKSRIPAGNYIAKKKKSKKFNRICWYIQDVPGRTKIILNHKGNSARDFSGCIGLGSEPYGDFHGERGVTYTSGTCSKFMELTKDVEVLSVKIVDC